MRDPLTSAPTSCLTKLGPDDDVEAYLEVFHWAHILSPFLTGPAQQTSQDLTSGPVRTRHYNRRYWPTTAIASPGRSASMTGGLTTVMGAIRTAIRTQISQHGRLIRWLAINDGPSILDRVLIDNSSRWTP